MDYVNPWNNHLYFAIVSYFLPDGVNKGVSKIKEKVSKKEDEIVKTEIIDNENRCYPKSKYLSLFALALLLLVFAFIPYF